MIRVYKVSHCVDVSKIVGGFSKGTDTPFDFEWGTYDFLIKGPVANYWTKELAKHKNFEVDNTPAQFDGKNLCVGGKIFPTGYCVLTKAVIFQSGKGRWSHQNPSRSLSEELVRFDYWIVCDVIRLADSKNPRVVWYQMPSDLLFSASETGLLTKQGWGRRKFFHTVREWNSKLGLVA